MVRLTMTPAMIEALTLHPTDPPSPSTDTALKHDETNASEPPLNFPLVGNPISHTQVLDLCRKCKALPGADGAKSFSLEALLRGAKIYTPPPKPRAEPTQEYRRLMARLRKEQEEREYQKMATPSLPHTKLETFAQRFPNAPQLPGHGFGQIHAPTSADDLGDDGITYNDVHRQSMLVINFLVTIFGSAAALWIIGRWWSTPARLFLAMGGSAVIGIAEVALYQGYIWHLSEAKKKDGKLKENKQIVDTWIVGQDKSEEAISVDAVDEVKSGDDEGVRRRK